MAPSLIVEEPTETPRTFWQTLGGYEYEVAEDKGSGGSTYTDWMRCRGGVLADGRFPEFNMKTGETRYRTVRQSAA